MERHCKIFQATAIRTILVAERLGKITAQTKGKRGGGISMILQPDGINEDKTVRYKPVDDSLTVQNLVLCHHHKHYGQGRESPTASPDIIDLLGKSETTHFCNHVLDGESDLSNVPGTLAELL